MLTVEDIQRKADKPFTKSYEELEKLAKDVPELFSKNAFAPIFKSTTDKHLADAGAQDFSQPEQGGGRKHKKENYVEMRYDDFAEVVSKNPAKNLQEGAMRSNLENNYMEEGIREQGVVNKKGNQGPQQGDGIHQARDPNMGAIPQMDVYKHGIHQGGRGEQFITAHGMQQGDYGDEYGQLNAEDVEQLEADGFHMQHQQHMYGHPMMHSPMGHMGGKGMPYANQHPGYYYAQHHQQHGMNHPYGMQMPPQKTAPLKKQPTSGPEKEGSDNEETDQKVDANAAQLEARDPYQYGNPERFQHMYMPQHGYYYGEEEDMHHPGMHMGGQAYHPHHHQGYYGKGHPDPRYNMHGSPMHMGYADPYMQQYEHYGYEHHHPQMHGGYDMTGHMGMVHEDKEDSEPGDRSQRGKNSQQPQQKKTPREPLNNRDPTNTSGNKGPQGSKIAAQPPQGMGQPQGQNPQKKPNEVKKSSKDQQIGQPIASPMMHGQRELQQGGNSNRVSAPGTPAGQPNQKKPYQQLAHQNSSSSQNIPSGGQGQLYKQNSGKPGGQTNPSGESGQNNMVQGGQNQQRMNNKGPQSQQVIQTQPRAPINPQNRNANSSQDLNPQAGSNVSPQQRKKNPHPQQNGIQNYENPNPQISPDSKPRQLNQGGYKDQVAMSPQQSPQMVPQHYQRQSTANQNPNMMQGRNNFNPMMMQMMPNMGGNPQMNHMGMMGMGNPQSGPHGNPQLNAQPPQGSPQQRPRTDKPRKIPSSSNQEEENDAEMLDNYYEERSGAGSSNKQSNKKGQVFFVKK